MDRAVGTARFWTVRSAPAEPDRTELLSITELRTERGVTIATRTGVNTGEVVASDPTSNQRLVTGDAANVAARLELAAQPGDILISESTYRLVRDAVHAQAVEPLTLKGKAEPVPAYRLLEVIRKAPKHFVAVHKRLAAAESAEQIGQVELDVRTVGLRTKPHSDATSPDWLFRPAVASARAC